MTRTRCISLLICIAILYFYPLFSSNNDAEYAFESRFAFKRGLAVRLASAKANLKKIEKKEKPQELKNALKELKKAQETTKTKKLNVSAIIGEVREMMDESLQRSVKIQNLLKKCKEKHFKVMMNG